MIWPEPSLKYLISFNPHNPSESLVFLFPGSDKDTVPKLITGKWQSQALHPGLIPTLVLTTTE